MLDKLITPEKKKRTHDALKDLGKSVKEGFVKGSQEIFSWFKEFFKNTKEKGLMASLMGPLIGWAEVIKGIKTGEKKETSTPIKTAKAKLKQQIDTRIRQTEPTAPEKIEKLHPEGYWRLKHPKYGVVHVWHPEYRGDPPTEIVVALHGYSQKKKIFRKNPDHFWSRYGKLRQQFKKSGKKALFIVPQGPNDNKESGKYWNGRENSKRKLDLKGLISFSKAKTGAEAKNNVTLIGHSGAYTTIASWLHNKDVKNIILLDSFYGYHKKFHRWAKKEGHKMVVVASPKNPYYNHQKAARKFLKPFPDATILKKTPTSITAKLSNAKVVLIETRFSHGAIITSGKVIPNVLGLVGNKPIEKSPQTDSEKERFARRQESVIMSKSGSRVLKYKPDTSQVRKLTNNFSTNESLVSAQDALSKRYKLKESVNGSFQYARQVARNLGYDIRIFSGYRSYDSQQSIYERTSPKRRGKYVAAPGTSWHHSGGATDVMLVNLSTGKKLTSSSSKSDRFKDILEYCMNRAGFVRYSAEYWHFEIGSPGWAKVMQNQGHIKKAESLTKYAYKREGYNKYLALKKQQHRHRRT